MKVIVGQLVMDLFQVGKTYEVGTQSKDGQFDIYNQCQVKEKVSGRILLEVYEKNDEEVIGVEWVDWETVRTVKEV
ncbi:hypothetical protein CN495_08500 [Bacillus thuringiensis]|uniref:Uncharacterized protein n=1 Tax=Bacillus thuringiensis TaxID=1428 RepID=A0ABD6SCY2_BACTU|nr:hypothetical protein [Bacillus thuringiensis]PER55782.1 hypothetical protein CN495_08500 [Bacillus thuringiensis]